MSRFEQPVEDARAAFGIDEDARVALVFGADHGNKDLETVWRAFLALPSGRCWSWATSAMRFERSLRSTTRPMPSSWAGTSTR